jgi:hypothetical protein
MGKSYELRNVSENLVSDEEGDELYHFLKDSAYLSTFDLSDLGTRFEMKSLGRRNRTLVRYLSALMPDKSLDELASVIQFTMRNPRVTVAEVRGILNGGTGDVPLAKVQLIGKYLRQGNSMLKSARDAGVSFETVSRIESFLGIHEAWRLKLMDLACNAVRDSLSVRSFSASVGIPKSTAHVMLMQARHLLQELGDI